MATKTLRLAIDPSRAVAGANTYTGAVTAADSASVRLAKSVGVLGAAFAIGTVIKSSTRAAIEWELAMTGVAKTTDLSAVQLRAMGDELRALSEQIPVTANELASIAETAGQLGIAEANIVEFTRVMADLGVATNLTSNEAATSLARFANVMGTSQTEFDRLGSTVVALGNNLATTEREIVEFGQRMSGAGRIAGLTESQVLALGGALSSVGVEAEAGGTAVQNALLGINTAVAEGNAQLQTFAATAGMSADQFATAWRDDAGAAFVSFIEGLGTQGDSAATTLDELGLGGARSARAFLSLANAGDLARESLELGNEAWAENNALTTEAERFYAALGNQLQTLRNQITNAAADLGANFTPALQFAIDNADLLKDAMVALGTAAAVAGAVALANAIAGWTAAFISLATTVRSASAAFALLNLAIGPTGWVILGLGAVATAFMTSRDAIRANREEVEKIDDAYRDAAEAMETMNRAGTRAMLEGVTRAFEQQRQVVADLRAELESIPTGGMGVSQRGIELQSELGRANKELERLEALLVQTGQRWTEFGAEAESALSAVGGSGGATAVDPARAERIAALRDEVEAQRMLRDAALESEDAYERVADAIELNNRVSEAIADLKGEEVEITRALVVEQFELEKATDAAIAARERAAAAVEEAEAQALRQAEAAAQEAARRDDLIDGLENELDAQRKLAAARKVGLDAVRQVQVQLAGEAAVRRLGADATDEQREAVRALAEELERLNIIAAQDNGAQEFESDWVTAAQAVGASVGGVASQMANLVSLAASGDMRSLAVGAAGFLGGLLGGAFGPSPEQQAREREAARMMQSNTEALRRLADELEGQGVTAAQATLAAEQSAAALEALRGMMGGVIPSDFTMSGRRLEDLTGGEIDIGVLRRLAEEQNIDLFTESGGINARALQDLIDAIQFYVEEIERQEAALMRNLRVRELEAQGADEAARKMREQIEREKELDAAREAGFSESAIARLEEIQQLEAATAARERLVEQLKAQRRAELEISAREAALAGDDRGALEAQLQAQAEAELARAQALVDAGEMTAEQFARLAAVINGEMSEALQNFEEDARRVSQEITNNLQLRLLSASGMNEEAEALRDLIELEEARRQGYTAQQLALLEQVQAAEAAQRAQQRSNQAQRETAEAAERTARALNAPQGLRLSLLRFQASALSVADRSRSSATTTRQPPPASNAWGYAGPGAIVTDRVPESTTNVQPGAITINVHAAPGMDENTLVRRIEEKWNRKLRAGGQPLIFTGRS